MSRTAAPWRPARSSGGTGSRSTSTARRTRRRWNLRPNNLLFAEEIRDACLAGCTAFHFGRTDVADEGLRRFKAGWGAEELPLHSTWFGASPREERAGPPAALRAVLRRSPEFVARAIGNAIYRYAA